MNFLVVVIGIILINAIFGLIPTFYPDSDPGVTIPYQFWISTLLFLSWLLPTTKAKYLFGKYDTEEDIIKDKEVPPVVVGEEVSTKEEPSVQSLPLGN